MSGNLRLRIAPSESGGTIIPYGDASGNQYSNYTEWTFNTGTPGPYYLNFEVDVSSYAASSLMALLLSISITLLAADAGTTGSTISHL